MATSTTTPPRVSILFLAYNQEQLVRRAAQSCLAQDFEPLEIVLSDDASTDNTYAELQAVAAQYRGPHKVIVRRSEKNVGIGEHYNQLVKVASGDLLVTAAGDDWSEPHRVRRIVEAWDANGRRADLIASHVRDLDHDGNLHEVIRVDDLGAYKGVDDWAHKRPYIIGAGHAFTRRMMERFGPMDPGIAYEDQIMVFRAIVSGGAITVDEALVDYRRGGTSRLPVFESIAQMRTWNDRQSARVLAEREQLLADARLAGCEEPVYKLMEAPMRRERYLHDLRHADTHGERWKIFQAAPQLPTWWRLRKLLHASFPGATVKVKQGLSALHRRQHW